MAKENVCVSLLSLFVMSVMLREAELLQNGPNQQPRNCKEGWLAYDHACYLFEDILFDWTGAKKACMSHSASLLEIESETERQWISSQLMDDKEITSKWIGQREHTSSSINQGDIQTSNYAIPLAVEPDRANGMENCVALTHNGFFRNEVCSKVTDGICKANKSNPNDHCPYHYPIAETSEFCYFQTGRNLNWSESLRNCQNQGTSVDLLSITDVGDLTIVRKGIESNIYTNNWWTGLHYNTQTNEYQFTDGTLYLKEVVQWMVTTARDEGCNALLSSGKLVKNNCESLYQYICKYPLVSRPVTGCPTNWLRVSNSCYYISEHHKVNWTQAKAECRSIGGHLLKTDSNEERHWLEKSVAFFLHCHWTGLNARSHQGAYVWDDGSRMNESLITWFKESPYPYRCATLDPSTGEMEEEECSTLVESLACEYKKSGNQTNCARGWLSRGHFDNKCYFFSTAYEVTWHANINECRKQLNGQNLDINYITIESNEEKDFIVKTLESLKIDTIIWLGLNSLDNENVWIWAGAPDVPGNDIFPLHYAGEPNTQYRCVYIYQGLYFTANCSTLRSYVCEKEINLSSGKGGVNPMATGPVCKARILCTYFVLYIFFIKRVAQ